MLLTFLLIPVFLGLLVAALVMGRNDWLAYAGIALAGCLICGLLNFMMSGRLRCPLCMVPPLLNRRCSRHRTAKKLFGSHKLRVAHSIIFKDSFRCPYCGEPTAMAVRERRMR